MSHYSIEAVGLGKRYQIVHERNRYETMRDRLAATFTAPFRQAGRLLRGQPAPGAAEEFWALREASFQVRPGEVVGIIGRNGAGKSTLLKILTRITEPSEGHADIRGRVGSLLEVGTGFHPELTGRENVFLNGSILGMRRFEIARRFDEIVAFAEVEKFLDTPVKHYSSGMYMRLAFAVAAHLEPEVLLVDEVLAVGDSAFQKKCLDKMEAVGRDGRTILFVSHNMPAITRLCPRTLLLSGGRIIQDGPSQQVVGTYLSSGLGTTAARVWNDPAQAPGDEVVRLRAVRVRAASGEATDALDIRQPVGIELEYEVLRAGLTLHPHFTLHNDEGVFVFSSFDQDPAWRGQTRPAGRYTSTAWIPGNFLSEGTCIIGAGLLTAPPQVLRFYERDVVAFQVIDSQDEDTARGGLAGRIPGVVRPRLNWQTQFFGANGHAVALPAAAGQPSREASL